MQGTFQRYTTGERFRRIIGSLNARGIRNSRGNPFTKNSFHTLLKNSRYLGEYRYKDTIIPDAIPAIIDLDCFGAMKYRCAIHCQAPAHNKADVHYLTKLFWGKCGTMMAEESSRNHTGTVRYYCLMEHMQEIAGLLGIQRKLPDMGTSPPRCGRDTSI